MKTIKTNQISVEQFTDIYEFCDTIQKRPANKVFKDERLASRRIEHSDDDWYGTQTWDEADDLMRNGYDVGVQNIVNCKIEDKAIGKRNLPKTDIVGYAPHIPNAIAQNPFNMINTKQHKRPVREITLLYDRSCSGDISSYMMILGARLVLDAIKSIEMAGVRVNLYLADLSTTRRQNQTVAVMIKLKDAKQPINLLKVAYPLVHTSFLRRHIFSWTETTPLVTMHNFLDTYGVPLISSKAWTMKEMRDFCVSNGLIPETGSYISLQKVVNSNYLASDIVHDISRQTNIKITNN